MFSSITLSVDFHSLIAQRTAFGKHNSNITIVQIFLSQLLVLSSIQYHYWFDVSISVGVNQVFFMNHIESVMQMSLLIHKLSYVNNSMVKWSTIAVAQCNWICVCNRFFEYLNTQLSRRTILMGFLGICHTGNRQIPYGTCFCMPFVFLSMFHHTSRKFWIIRM